MNLLMVFLGTMVAVGVMVLLIKYDGLGTLLTGILEVFGRLVIEIVAGISG